LFQERARFRRNYPPLSGSYDPHYHWRGTTNPETRHVDDILSRLVEVSVGPVEQVPPCACKVPSRSLPPTDSRTPYSHIDNGVDSSLPYNPWYGSHTEHRLQAMSIDDGASQVQIISPLRTVLARPLVHGEEEWDKVEGLDQNTSVAEMSSMSPTNEAMFVGLVERNLNVHTPSAELHTELDSDSAGKDETASVAAEVPIATEQTSVLPATPEETSASQTDSSVSKLQNAESPTTKEEESASTEQLHQDVEQARNVDGAVESEVKTPATDNELAISKVGPEDGSKLPEGGTDDDHATMIVPAVSVLENSSSKGNAIFFSLSLYFLRFFPLHCV